MEDIILNIKIKVDTSEIDVAIEKIKKLEELEKAYKRRKENEEWILDDRLDPPKEKFMMGK